jgi:Bacterial regulatory protein, arsR family
VQTYWNSGWTALGDPTRRAIFERLADRPRAVGELASELPVSRPGVAGAEGWPLYLERYAALVAEEG